MAVYIIKSNKLRKRFRVYVRRDNDFGSRLIDFILGNTNKLTYRGYDITKFAKSLKLDISKSFTEKEWKSAPKKDRNLPTFSDILFDSINKLK